MQAACTLSGLGLESQRMALSISDSYNEREHWNRKNREAPGSWMVADPFLVRAFSEYIPPLFPSWWRGKKSQPAAPTLQPAPARI
jgi:hypothetical protein